MVYIGRLFTDWLYRGCQTPSLAWLRAGAAPALRRAGGHIGYAFSIITGVLGAGWFAFGHLIMHGGFERNFSTSTSPAATWCR